MPKQPKQKVKGIKGWIFIYGKKDSPVIWFNKPTLEEIKFLQLLGLTNYYQCIITPITKK